MWYAAAFVGGIFVSSIVWRIITHKVATKAATDAMMIGYSVAIDHLSEGVFSDALYLEGKFRNPSQGISYVERGERFKDEQ